LHPAFEKLEAPKNNIDELKGEIEQLKYFNRVLSFKVKTKKRL